MSGWWVSPAEHRLMAHLLAQHLSDLAFNFRRWQRWWRSAEARKSIRSGPTLRTYVVCDKRTIIYEIPKADRIKKYQQVRRAARGGKS